MDWIVNKELKAFICHGFKLIKHSSDYSEKQKIELIDRLCQWELAWDGDQKKYQSMR